MMKPIRTRHSFSRILLLHTGSLSEVVFALPACIALRERFPEARLTGVATSWGCELLALSGAVSDCWPIPRTHPLELLVPWNAVEVLQTIWEFREQRYELAVDFHPSGGTALLAVMAGVRARLTALRPEGISGLLFNVWRVPDDPRRHLVDRYLDAVRALDISPTSRVPAVRTDPDADERFDRWLRSRGGKAGELLVGFSPEADSEAAAWPMDRFRELARCLVAHFQVRILDVRIGRPTRAGFPAGTLTVRPRSVRDLASALARCALVISGDTGPGHLAAALGVPTLMLGCARTRHPLGEAHRFVERALLDHYSVDHIFEMASEMLGRSRTVELFRR
jgi:ADP-heptose:LPS heptosyltransferase